MKRIALGMVAHVDAGKTTLSEALLFRTGTIRKPGRVDHADAFLDTNSIERNRGITIFSKQAIINLGDTELTLLDTPGHVDFSAETERTLNVLDAAVLVISGTDGVQSHTETLWRLLARYDIPTFIFVNKMDISYLGKESLLNELKKRLSAGCIDFSDKETLEERIAECDEDAMNAFLDSGKISDDIISRAVRKRTVFPCLFGSALKINGIDELISLICAYSSSRQYYNEFAAKIFKITQDEQGARLTHLKVTGGTLKVKSLIDAGGLSEKVNQIRIYSGMKYRLTEEAPAGTICAVTGLTKSFAGECLGAEKDASSPVLEPVLSYRVILPQGADEHTVLEQFRTLEEEDPQLHITWNSRLREITVSLMGDIQLEVLKTIIKERFALDVEFDSGSIAYKETIEAPVIGAGHYEPLRHYAEVQLLMEPAERGTGLHFSSDVSEDKLDRNWQRLILTHLEEKTHIGVLTGSPITDMKITLVAGKAHLKHTEGGDFRQATYRAVRQGLRSAESVLLEPWYSFTLEIPAENVGRAMTDLQRMGAEFSQPEGMETAIINGKVPVSEFRGYQSEMLGYTKGKGRLNCTPCGFFPCHETDKVIAAIGYDCDSDTENSADSVFCSHGSGELVKWDVARQRMHTDPGISFGSDVSETESSPVTPERISSYKQRIADDNELMAIFERTYGKINRDPHAAMRREKQAESHKIPKCVPILTGPEYLLVDGYNIIFAWDELKELAKSGLDAARNRLINILCNYQGFRQCNLILVFDAYKVKGNHREIEKEQNITVVYTKEAETADMYIEKTAHDLSKKYRVRVATSDNIEQIIIMGSGALRVSASEFYDEVKLVEKTIREIIGG
ncbi:MAG: NYN domain-containing protein [Oscillospiraceae bacterium]